MMITDILPRLGFRQSDADETDNRSDESELSRSGRRTIATTVGLYLGAHAIAGLSLLAVLHAHHLTTTDFLRHGWDASFYLDIAQHGYQHSNQYAFFPLFPFCVRAFSYVGIGFFRAGFLVATIAGVFAAVGLQRIGERLENARVGLILALMWAVIPTSIMQVWPYADVLFAALAIWALDAVVRRAWLVAGLLTFLAGLTRPSAAVLVLAVGVAALVAMVRRQDGWRPYAGAAIAPLGLVGFVAFVDHHFGKLDGYTHMQRVVWSNWFDGGKETVDTLSAMVDGRNNNPPVLYLIAVVTTLAVPFLLWLAILQRQPLPFLVFGFALAAFVLGSHRQFYTLPRELMAGFPLLLPMASALSRVRTPRLGVTLTVVAALSGWYAWFMPIMFGAP